MALGARLLGWPSSWSAALLVLPFLPDGGLREFYDRTLGYQASRSSPFSVWGLAPSLDFLRPVERARGGGPGAGGRLVAPPKDPRPGRGAGGGGADRRPAGGDPLVLLLRRLVPAAGARGDVRGAAERAQPIRVSSSPRLGELIAISSPGDSHTLGIAGRAHPGGRPGGDDVAGLEGHQRRQPRDELAGRRRSGRRWRPTASARRSGSASKEIGAVGERLIGGDERRPAGRRAVEHLARHPLRGGELEVARREVVEQHVAGDAVEAPRPRCTPEHRRPITNATSASKSTLSLASGSGTVAPGAARAFVNLAKKVGASGRLDPRLGGVRPVVEPDADDLLRVGHRRQQLHRRRGASPRASGISATSDRRPDSSSSRTLDAARRPGRSRCRPRLRCEAAPPARPDRTGRSRSSSRRQTSLHPRISAARAGRPAFHRGRSSVG